MVRGDPLDLVRRTENDRHPLMQLLRLHVEDPLFANTRFRRVTNDAFFIAIEASDPKFEVEGTERLLREAGGTGVTWVEV